MDRERFLALLAADGELFLDTARNGDLDAPVPTCPGWTVRDAVTHTAEVYEHKMESIRLAGPAPDPWPPAWPDRDPVEWYADALHRLLDVLRTTDPNAPSHTWWPPDQTAGFWTRRMAQETAVHRVDVQSAYGAITPLDPELATDGVDESLVQQLAGPWWSGEWGKQYAHLTGRIRIETGGRAWLVDMEPANVTVTEPAPNDADAVVTGEPSDMDLWLWGRLPDDVVTMTGDEQALANLRARLNIAND